MNPILRPRALISGYSDGEIRRLRANGMWKSVRRGGYLPTDAFTPMDTAQRHEVLVRATVPALRVPAIVSHCSAAVLLGIPLWSTHLGIVHITRQPPGYNGRSASLLTHVSAMESDEITVIGGIKVTSAARTIADLGRILPFEQAVVAADAALRMGLTTKLLLHQSVERISGAPRSRSALKVVQFADGLSESVGESRSRVMMHRADLPAPTLQFEVHNSHGQLLGRSDYAWHGGRLLGEFDGKSKYEKLLKPGESPSEVVVREKRREDALRDNGARVIRWVWDELDQPARLAERIRRAIASVEREMHL